MTENCGFFVILLKWFNELSLHELLRYAKFAQDLYEDEHSVHERFCR